MGDFKKIGVWNTAFLGDAVLTLPLIQALHGAWPEAEIHYFVRGGLENLFEPQPNITTATGFYKRAGQKSLPAALRLGKDIGTQGFDLWISAHTSLRSALVAKSTGVAMRIGYAAPWPGRLAYTHTVPRRFTELEEVERLMQLTLPLGIHGPAPKASLAVPEDSRARARQALGADSRPWLGVHPGSTWPTKKWPTDRFAAIIRRAVEAGARVAVFAGPGEEADAAAAIAASGHAGSPAILDLSGQLSLPELAAHIAAVDTYLTNDSGPMHLAWMLGVPTVALFGPTVRALGFFPRGERSRVMEVSGLPCRPCGLHGPKKCPKGHFRCMLDLAPEMVWETVRGLLFT